MSSSHTGRTQVSSWSMVGLRNSGAVSRTKSFQNWPASCSTGNPSGPGPGGGASSTRSSSKPNGASLPSQDRSAANTTR